MDDKEGRPATREQAQAWLYEVIAPLCDGLRREVRFLVLNQSASWRFQDERCEFVSTLRNYVERYQEPTFEQFLRFNRDLERVVQEHDIQLERLNTAGARAHRALIETPDIRAIADDMERQFPGWRGSTPIQDAVASIAEDALNLQTWDVLPHFSHAAAWMAFKTRIRALRSAEQAAALVGHFDHCRQALGSTSEALLAALIRRRDELADGHGLPPVQKDYRAFLQETP